MESYIPLSTPMTLASALCLVGDYHHGECGVQGLTTYLEKWLLYNGHLCGEVNSVGLATVGANSEASADTPEG